MSSVYIIRTNLVLTLVPFTYIVIVARVGNSQIAGISNKTGRFVRMSARGQRINMHEERNAHMTAADVRPFLWEFVHNDCWLL